MMGTVLVVVSGLPGAGKSALAEAVGRVLPAPVLSVDPVEAAIWRCGINPCFETGVAAYEIVAVMATHQIQLGLTVIVDAVTSVEVARQTWRDAATRADAMMRVTEVVCGDETTHRDRLARRVRDIDDFPEPSWDDVLARRDEWEPWKEPRLLIDSTRGPADNLAEALSYVSR